MPWPLIAMGVGSLLGRLGGGAAKERGGQNEFTLGQDRTKATNYNTQQDAALNALLAAGKDRMTGYQTRQGATTDALQGLQGAHTAARQGESAEKIALAKLGLDAPMANARASILGSAMKNLQPSSFQSPTGQQGHLTKFSGGLTAATLDPMTRQHGEALMKAALEKQLSGGGLPGATDFQGGIQDWSKGVLDVPEATDYSKGLIAPPDLGEYKKAGALETILSTLGAGLSGAGIVGGGVGGKTPEWNYDDQKYGD